MLTLQILFPLAILLKFWLSGRSLTFGHYFPKPGPQLPRNS